MRFTPQTEQEVTESNLIPAGIYPFTVTSAEDKVSKKSGAPMMQLSLEVFAADGKSRKVTDYIMEAVAYKLRHFAMAVGMGDQYTRDGELKPHDMLGRSGSCMIRVEPAEGNFSAKNSVKDYVPLKDGEEATPAPKRAAASDESDPAPF